MPKIDEDSDVSANPTAVGAYIFAGGFTVGVKRAGFDVLAHLEGGPYGVATAAMNWPDLLIAYPEPNWPVESLAERRGGIDFVYCNPPCAVFSPMGIVTTRGEGSWRTDPRTECWHHAFRLIDRVKPRFWACESVPQAYTRGREMIDDMTRVAVASGYSVVHLLEDAMYTGLPQSRKRFFLVCHRPEFDFRPSYDFRRPPTVGETLAKVDDPGYSTVHPKLMPLVPLTPEGGRLSTTWMEQNPDWDSRRNSRGQVAGRPSFQDKRLSRDGVMPAYVGDKFYHPTQNRMIGINEAKALCGYPRDFKLEGRPSGWGSLLARAVMPNVGEWLARRVVKALTSRRVDRATPTVKLVDLRKPPPIIRDLTGEYGPRSASTTISARPTETSTPRLPQSRETRITSSVPAIRRSPTRVLPIAQRSRAGSRTVLVTGSTPVQVGSDRTELDIVTAVRGYVAAMTHLGYDVDWRPVTPGEDLSRYEAVVAAIQKPNSIASRHFYGALWALSSRDDSIAVIDDWQTDSILGGAKTYATSPSRAFRLRSDSEFSDVRDEVFSQLERFASGDWPWPVVVPTIGASDVSLLKLPTDRVVEIDPTPFSRRYRRVGARPPKSRRWVYASLMTRTPVACKWPIAQFGCPDKGKGGVGPSGPNAKPRLRESELADEYLVSWGVLSPTHPHAGSGWWRVRYLMSADARCVLSADPREAKCLGEAYVEASDVAAVETLRESELRDLAWAQKERIDEIAWSPERTADAWKSLLVK